jgi:hypothetical protein
VAVPKCETVIVHKRGYCVLGVHLKYNLSNSPVNDLSHLEVLWCEVFALEEVEGFDLKVQTNGFSCHQN